MKTVKYLVATFVVAVLMTGCVTTRESSMEEEDEENVTRIGNRVYVDDPYYGRVILERDPFTGRYHDVTIGQRGYSPYNNYRSYPRYYNNSPRSYNNYNSGAVQRPSQEPIQKTREETRKKVLGNN